MGDTQYGMKTTTTMSVAEAEARVTDALAEEGFGILTEIDVAAVLKAKLGIERGAYRILGACKPDLAAKALDAEVDIGLLLPCNVVIYTDGSATTVAIIDPATMVTLAENPAIGAVAAEARDRLERVLGSLNQ